jgi:stage II sporulation protein R
LERFTDNHGNYSRIGGEHLTGTNKKILLTIIVFLVVLLSAFYLRQEQDTKTEVSGSGEFIRLHVVANSDSLFDQDLKRKVRDAIVQDVAPGFLAIDDIASARDIARNNLDLIQETADREVRTAGREYPVRVELACFPFPTKHYGPFILPAGEYEAVRVVIGEGGGTNWWCVLFPPLCFVDLTRNAAAVNPYSNGGQVPITPEPGAAMPGAVLEGGKTGSDRGNGFNPGSGFNTWKGSGSGTLNGSGPFDDTGFVSSFGFGGNRGTVFDPAAPCPVPLSEEEECLLSGQAIPETIEDTGVRVVFSCRILEFFRSLKG